MKLRDIVKEMNPDKVSKCYDGGVLGCPHDYDYLKGHYDHPCDDLYTCKDCWDQEYQNTEDTITPYQRPSKTEYYLDIAYAVSKRSTCLKRRYGCIIVKDDRIVATGYNGSPRGYENCCYKGSCPRMVKEHNSGDYSDCPAVHAEQNALLSASREDLRGSILYLSGDELVDGVPTRMDSCTPCPICDRMIRNSGIIEVIGCKE